MFFRNRLAMLALPIAGITLTLIGCQKSSRSSVYTYDYSDQGRTQQPAQEGAAPREQPPSDYQMASPGQMAAPGEMVPPGRPVVEPRHNP